MPAWGDYIMYFQNCSNQQSPGRAELTSSSCPIKFDQILIFGGYYTDTPSPEENVARMSEHYGAQFCAKIHIDWCIVLGRKTDICVNEIPAFCSVGNPALISNK